jgi:hypothetical protein
VFQETYEMALARVMINAASAADRENDRIELIFAHTQEIKGELIQRYFDRLDWRRDGINAVGHRLSLDAPPLQAAEIVARGMKRWMQDRFFTRSWAPASRSTIGRGRAADP